MGVNRWPAQTEPLEVFAIDPAMEAEQAGSVQRLRAQRDAQEVSRCLDDLYEAVRAGDNVVPATVAAVKAYATIGEIVQRIRQVHGAWRPTTAY